jgi:GNAT superfamily N-acetyltransferase
MDMLIKLYALPASDAGRVLRNDVRKPLGPEHDLAVDSVAREFSPGWASEARAALGNRPVSMYVALLDGALAGFCCYDATARGLVGPIGVAESARGQGVGAALLRACICDMQPVGILLCGRRRGRGARVLSPRGGRGTDRRIDAWHLSRLVAALSASRSTRCFAGALQDRCASERSHCGGTDFNPRADREARGGRVAPSVRRTRAGNPPRQVPIGSAAAFARRRRVAAAGGRLARRC